MQLLGPCGSRGLSRRATAETGWTLALEMKLGTEGHPRRGLHGSHKSFAFFRREYSELRWLVRQRRVGRAQDHHRSNPSLVAAEGEGHNYIFGPA